MGRRRIPLNDIRGIIKKNKTIIIIINSALILLKRRVYPIHILHTIILLHYYGMGKKFVEKKTQSFVFMGRNFVNDKKRSSNKIIIKNRMIPGTGRYLNKPGSSFSSFWGRVKIFKSKIKSYIISKMVFKHFPRPILKSSITFRNTRMVDQTNFFS